METTTWICDTCGRPIEKAEDGWVEWLSDPDVDQGKMYYGLRLVHRYGRSPLNPQGRCQYDAHGGAPGGGMVNDVDQTNYMGPGGLIELLSMLGDKYFQFKDQNEVLTMIQRLHVPGYERAHRHFPEAIDQGVFEPNTPEGFYPLSAIEAVNNWLASKGEE